MATSNSDSKARGTQGIDPRNYPGPKVASEKSLRLQLPWDRQATSPQIHRSKATIVVAVLSFSPLQSLGTGGDVTLT